MPLEEKPDGRLILRTAITLRPDREADIIEHIRLALENKIKLATVIRELMRSGAKPTATAEEEDELDLSGLGEEI